MPLEPARTRMAGSRKGNHHDTFCYRFHEQLGLGESSVLEPGGRSLQGRETNPSLTKTRSCEYRFMDGSVLARRIRSQREKCCLCPRSRQDVNIQACKPPARRSSFLLFQRVKSWLAACTPCAIRVSGISRPSSSTIAGSGQRPRLPAPLAQDSSRTAPTLVLARP